VITFSERFRGEGGGRGNNPGPPLEGGGDKQERREERGGRRILVHLNTVRLVRGAVLRSQNRFNKCGVESGERIGTQQLGNTNRYLAARHTCVKTQPHKPSLE